MARVQLFVSTVSAEFLSYRERLRHLLTRPDVEVKVQEDFIVTGDETLEMLDAYIQGCDGVIHLVGDMTGAMAKPQSVAAIAKRYPELASRFPLAEFLQPNGPSLSYTQWEAWLALLHGKKLYIATPEARAKRDKKYMLVASQQALQRAHLSRLKEVARYPGTAFTSHEHLVAEVSVSFILDLLVQAGMNRRPVNLPFKSIGALFKGRAALMEQLESATNPVALIGQGGVGKTRLAIEHAWKQVGRCNAVLLIRAASAEGLNHNLAGLCGHQALDLPQKDEREEALQRVAVLQWLQVNPGWLLVLDSVDTPEAAEVIEALLPQLGAGQVIITTRLRNWSVAVQSLDVELLDPEDAREFLLERTEERRKNAVDDAKTAEAIAVEDLGRLALALEQAGAYISMRGLSFEAYRQQWKENRADLLCWLDPRLMQYDRSLATTWFTSYQQLDPSARTLFRRLAWLSPEPIPECLLDVVVLGDPEASRTAKDSLSQLDGYSLINRYLENSTFDVHRLTQEASRIIQAQPCDSFSNELQNTLYWIAFAYNTESQAISRSSSPSLMDPHVARICRFAMHEGLVIPTGALISRLGITYYEKALYDLAEMCFRDALRIAESLFDASSPQIATAMINLATLLTNTNRANEAEPLVNRALAIDEAYYDSPHPAVARDLDSLALLHCQRGKLSIAEEFFRLALLTAQSSTSTSDLDLSSHLNNLAQLLKSTDNFNEALPLAQSALALAESQYGFNHPKTSVYLNNLAMLLSEVGQISDAQELISRAIRIDESSYRLAHPNLARSLNSLGILMLKEKQFANAEALFRRALTIDEEFYGPKHRNIAATLNNLGLTLLVSGQILEAEQCLHRAIKIDEELLGADHPEVATDLNHLTLLLQIANRLSEAEPLMRRIIAILKACSIQDFHYLRLEAGIANYRDLLQAMGLSEAEIQVKLQALLPPT